MKFFIFKKNIILFLILLFFTILQIKIGLFWGYSINFVLYFLIVSCFFVSYLELLFLNLIAILLINWKPSLNLEIILLFLIPQIFYLFLKLNKINLFLNLFFSLIVSNLLFYIFINYKIIFINLNYFLYDTLIGLFIGFFSFYLLKFLNYER